VTQRTKPVAPWRLCSACGSKRFPNADRDKMEAITVSLGDCPGCGTKAVWLIPISDFKYASKRETTVEEWD
jgi:hypothetical protein